MPEPRRPEGEADDPKIADADAFFLDQAPKRPAPSQGAGRPSRPPLNDAYEIEDVPEELARPSAAPIVTDGEERPRKARSEPKAKEGSRPGLDASEAVEQVWSRGAEWGGTITLLVIATLVILGGVFGLFSLEMYGASFLLMMAGVVLLGFLAYPIFVTLERPIRMTPEQAVRDYYTALSHHWPHYKRMWLLLSNAGRVGPAFASFDGFQSYWKGRMKELRARHASGSTPLRFVVVEFKSEKSAGKSAIDATYSVNVFVRGKNEAGPIATEKVSTTLVKGPDRMWYLDKGTLP